MKRVENLLSDSGFDCDNVGIVEKDDSPTYIVIVGAKASVDVGLKGQGYSTKTLPKGLTYSDKTGLVTGTCKTVTAAEGVEVTFAKAGEDDVIMTFVVRAENTPTIACEGLAKGTLTVGVGGGGAAETRDGDVGDGTPILPIAMDAESGVKSVTATTDLDFFSALPDSDETNLEARVTLELLPNALAVFLCVAVVANKVVANKRVLWYNAIKFGAFGEAMKKVTKKTITDNAVDPDILAYTVGEDPVLDLELAVWDCMGTAAHVTMLSEMKGLRRPIVTKAEAAKVRQELAKVVARVRRGQFEIRVDDQDVHMAVERLLTETLGDLGKKIHTGRSRNDQVAVDVRLHMKDAILATEAEVVELAKALCAFGSAAGAIPLVGRTHLQPAMPSTVEMWATGHAEMILDQLENLEAAYRLADLNPLGSAAGYGVPLPLDRRRTTELLGFSRTLHNCFGASMARGECEASLLSALAQTMCVLSRLAEDMILFSMPEFAYFKLPREYCTGSSIMPQKFNPDVLELVRGKTAQVIGWQTAALTLLHAMPGGYNRDLQDAKLLYMKGLETTRTTLRILAKVVAGMTVDPAACRAAFTPGVFATDVALRKVAAGTPWRDAYHNVRDHLEQLENENCDAAVAAKRHEGTCGGIDRALYRRRMAAACASVDRRRAALAACLDRLLK